MEKLLNPIAIAGNASQNFYYAFVKILSHCDKGPAFQASSPKTFPAGLLTGLFFAPRQGKSRKRSGTRVEASLFGKGAGDHRRERFFSALPDDCVLHSHIMAHPLRRAFKHALHGRDNRIRIFFDRMAHEAIPNNRIGKEGPFPICISLTYYWRSVIVFSTLRPHHTGVIADQTPTPCGG